MLNRQHGSKWELSLALSSISVIYTYTNELDKARSSAQEGLSIAQEIGNPWSIGLGLRSLARIAAQQGDIQEALSRFEQSVEIFEEQGNWGLVVVARSDLAHFLRRQGEIPAARAIYEQTIQEWFDHGSRPAVAHQLECFAFLAVSREDPIQAAILLGAAEMLRIESNSIRMGEEQEEYKQVVSHLSDQLDSDDYQEALNTGRFMDIEQAIAFALEN
jgi:tetratricopeptide (TPR) repeat protein